MQALNDLILEKTNELKKAAKGSSGVKFAKDAFSFQIK